MKNTEELAWAAGLFGAEGSSYYDRHKQAVSMAMSQITDNRQLVDRFQNALGLGKVGHHRHAKDNHRASVAWRLRGNHNSSKALNLIWPWLDLEKRQQALTAIQKLIKDHPEAQITIPREQHIPSPTEELAWAAGLFGGDGSIWHEALWNKRRVSMEVSQSTKNRAILERFYQVVSVGKIYDRKHRSTPRRPNPDSRWRAWTTEACLTVITLLWPWLDEYKRVCAVRSLEACGGDTSNLISYSP